MPIQPYICKHKNETNDASEANFHQKAYAHMLSHSLNAIPKAVVQLKEIKLDAISKVLSSMFLLCKEKIALVKASSLKELMPMELSKTVRLQNQVKGLHLLLKVRRLVCL